AGLQGRGCVAPPVLRVVRDAAMGNTAGRLATAGHRLQYAECLPVDREELLGREARQRRTGRASGSPARDRRLLRRASRSLLGRLDLRIAQVIVRYARPYSASAESDPSKSAAPARTHAARSRRKSHARAATWMSRS